MEKYIVNGDEVWERYSDDLFQGYARMNPPVKKNKPWLCYVGPRITIEEWRKILAFFKWGYEDYKGESQVRLYFNKEQKLWRAWAFPQEKEAGLSTKEIEEKEGDERQKADLGKGWIIGGTVHHHCGATAFQSGTDRQNESTQNGVHITVGKLDGAAYDIHGRLSFRGEFYDLDFSEWFQMPPGLEALPAIFAPQVMEYILARGVTDQDVFPAEWKDNVIRKAWTAPYTPPGSRTWAPWYASHDNDMEEKKDKEAGPVAQYLPMHRQGADHKNKKPLTKKERRLLRKLLERAGEQEELQNYTEDDTVKLQRVATQVIHLCASLGMETSELFACLLREPNHLDPIQANAVEEVQAVMEKEGVWPDELEDWLKTITMDEPTEGSARGAI